MPTSPLGAEAVNVILPLDLKRNGYICAKLENPASLSADDGKLKLSPFTSVPLKVPIKTGVKSVLEAISEPHLSTRKVHRVKNRRKRCDVSISIYGITCVEVLDVGAKAKAADEKNSKKITVNITDSIFSMLI